MALSLQQTAGNALVSRLVETGDADDDATGEAGDGRRLRRGPGEASLPPAAEVADAPPEVAAPTDANTSGFDGSGRDREIFRGLRDAADVRNDVGKPRPGADDALDTEAGANGSIGLSAERAERAPPGPGADADKAGKAGAAAAVPPAAPQPAAAAIAAPAPVAPIGSRARTGGSSRAAGTIPGPAAAPAGSPAAPPPTAAASGAPELDAWKASVAAATDAISEPQLDAVAAAPGKLDEQAAAVEEQRAGERPDFQQEAREQLPAAPKGPPPEEQLDTKAADAALASVDAAGKARLSDQTFPPLVPMPGGLVPPTSPAAAVAPAPGLDGAPPSAAPGGPAPADPKAQAVAGKLAAVQPVAAGKGPSGPSVVSDPGAASLDPLPPAQATHIGDVAARVLANAPAFAQQILDTASGALDPSKRVSPYQAIADRMLPIERQGVTTELEGIAAAAGVSGEALQAKVAAQQAAAERQAKAAAGQLDARATAAKAVVEQRGEQEQQRISGAGAAVREEVDRKQEATKGTSDPSVINGRRDAYLQKVEAAHAAGSARFRAAKERRVADLQRVAGEQKGAYQQQARLEAARAQGAPAPGKDPTAGRIAARPILDWAEQQGLEVDGHVARLTREAAKEVERYEQALTEAANSARDQIRDWAAERQGRQRSWWERLWDMITDWVSQSKAENKAWETQRNAETRDKVASDFTKLAKLRDDMAAGNRDAVFAEMSRMSKEERAVVNAFLRSGGRDAIGAVAAGLVERIKGHRVPELSKQLEEAAIAELPWEALNELGAMQTPGFDAGLIVRDVRGSVKGMGTNEKRLFKALTGRTPLQIAAMRKAYRAVYDRDMDEDVDDDVSGSEQDRADALLSGDPTAGAVATLHDAMSGAGTDEATIMQTLRGKTPAERDAIIAAYQERHGVALQDRLAEDMGGYELGQATALLEGDTTKADAMEIKEAMRGAGTDEQGINAVYARIRDDVEAGAAAKGMKTAEVEAEIKRRTEALKRTYGNVFAGGEEGALEAAYREEMSGGELNLALAAQAVDQTAMDAAKLQIEHEGAWTSDDTVNEILKAQHARAEKEVMRDLAVDFNAQAAKMTPDQRKAAWAELQKRGKALAEERSKQNMTALKGTYDSNNGGKGAFDALIALEVSGYSQDEALERIESGGKLSDAKELKYAVFGAGTNEQVIRDTLKGKSKDEIAVIKAEYKRVTGNDLADDLTGDLSGRDEADMTAILETGDSTPEEKLAYLRRRKEWELSEGTGEAGAGFVGEEARVLTATTAEAERAHADFERLKAQYGEDDPRTKAAKERLERWLGYGDKDIERHREELDSITDTIAMVGAIAVGVAVTVLTAGAAGPAVAAAAAALGTSTTVVAGVAGALAATAASMLIKQDMKGAAYGGEDIAVDLAQGTAEAIVAAATAGMGEAALRLLARSPAFAAIAGAGESGLLGRLAVKGGESGIEGMIQGLPSGMVAAILDENTWRSPNPLAVILEAGGKASAQGAGMGSVMGAGFEGFAGRGAPAGVHGDGPPTGGHGTPVPAGEVPQARGAPGETRPPGVDEAPPGGREPAAPSRGDESRGRVEGSAEPAGPPRTSTDDIPLIDMPEGTIMYGGDRPLSPAEAQTMYDNAIGDSASREAMILENVATGERIVIQGNESLAGAAPDAWAEFAAERMGGGVWRAVRHNHPIGKGGVTPVPDRYPSGAGGDLAGAAHDAQAAGKPHRETLDIVTENGKQEIHYGFDPGVERPYWIDLPGPDGTRIQRRFKSLESYHEWYETQTGRQLRTVGEDKPATRDPDAPPRERATPGDGDEEVPPWRADLDAVGDEATSRALEAAFPDPGRLERLVGNLGADLVVRLNGELDPARLAALAGRIDDAALQNLARGLAGPQIEALAAAHSRPMLEWAAGTLQGAEAAQLLGQPAGTLSHFQTPPAGTAIDAAAALRIVRALPAADLAAIVPAIRPDHMDELLRRFGAAAFADVTQSQIAEGKIRALERMATNLLAGGGTEFAVPPTPAGPSSAVLDNNTLSALRQLENGLPFARPPGSAPLPPGSPKASLQSIEQAMVNALAARANLHRPPGTPQIGPFDAANPATPADAARIRAILDIRAPNVVLGESAASAGGARAATLDVNRASPEYAAALAEMADPALARGPVGEATGGVDRAAVADAIFADRPPGTVPDFITADVAVFEGLIPFAVPPGPTIPPVNPPSGSPPGPPSRWHNRFARANGGGFVIELPSAPGRQIRIIPVGV